MKFQVHVVEENKNQISNYQFLSPRESFTSLVNGKSPEAAGATCSKLIGKRIYILQDFLTDRHRIGEPTEKDIDRAKQTLKWQTEKAASEGRINQFIEALNLAYDNHYTNFYFSRYDLASISAKP
jgi:hypothetical protein